MEEVIENVDSFDLLAYLGIDLNLSIIIAVAIIFIVGFILIKVTGKILAKTLTRTKLAPTMYRFIQSIVKVVLYVLLFLIILQTIGVEMSSIVAVIGVAGLAISLAIQDTLANVANGFIILATKPFEINDFVSLDGIEGNVAHITVMHTKLNTIDNKAIYIPNKLVASNQITNFSKEEKRRLELFFSIGYEDDFELAKSIISKIIVENEYALTDPEPLVRVCEHADSCIKIMTRVWVITDKYLDLKFDLLEQVKLEFDKNKINIPYQHINVIVQNNNPSVE